MIDPGEITLLLRQMCSGDPDAEAKLLPVIYHELKRLAAACLRGERPEHTLQPTALVHEAFLKLMQTGEANWKDRAHFFAAAARVMRHILVDYARTRNAKRRGGGDFKIPIDDNHSAEQRDYTTILAVHAALDRLHAMDARQARVVELRFFAGLTEEEIAEVLGLSARTVKRDWIAARAWLHAELTE